MRFSVVEHRGNELRLVWIHEREHAPAAHGFLEFSIAQNRFIEPADELLLGQARAFVESYTSAKTRDWLHISRP
ncbi:MAG TPA: hypothetical protein VFW83_09870 [Bryobacteraceae bacterium]|nr:hypothetical protein [Bryobacteraceae bacterium]